MKKIKTIIISIFLFLIVPIISAFLLEKIPSIYYDCSSTFPEAGYDICTTSPWGFAIPFILGLVVTVWYFYRSSSFIKSDKETKKEKN